MRALIISMEHAGDGLPRLHFDEKDALPLMMQQLHSIPANH